MTADPTARRVPGGQVGLAEVEVDVELVARERAPIGVHGDERREPGIDHVELHAGMGRAV